jgi:hypothetical protein
MIGWLIDRWRRLVPGSPRINRIRFYPEHAQVPDKLPRRELALIGGSEHEARWVAFECPCGTGHRIMVPLGEPPRWTLVRDDGVSLRPSIDSRTDYRCHFWLRHGRVHWSPTRARGRLRPL